MKKTVLFCLLISLVMTGFSQVSKLSKSEFVMNDRMHEVFSQSQLDDMYNNDFDVLFRLNYKMNNFARLSTKGVEGANEMGFIDQYAKKGVSVNEGKIVREGALNPFDFDFPQDEIKYNVFKLHTNGYYVIVPPKARFEADVEANLQQFVY